MMERLTLSEGIRIFTGGNTGWDVGVVVGEGVGVDMAVGIGVGGRILVDDGAAVEAALEDLERSGSPVDVTVGRGVPVGLDVAVFVEMSVGVEVQVLTAKGNGSLPLAIR
jgi:hypothetical protein